MILVPLSRISRRNCSEYFVSRSMIRYCLACNAPACQSALRSKKKRPASLRAACRLAPRIGQRWALDRGFFHALTAAGGPVADIRTDQQKKHLPFRTRAEQGITRLAQLNG